MAASTCCPSASRMSPKTTFAPSFVNVSASAAPWPRAPPLINATLPASRPPSGIVGSSLVGYGLCGHRVARQPAAGFALEDVIAPEAQPHGAPGGMRHVAGRQRVHLVLADPHREQGGVAQRVADGLGHTRGYGAGGALARPRHVLGADPDQHALAARAGAMRPWSITAMRSARISASWWSWVT